jgi:uncharacterized protein (DUF305 family)
MNRRTALIAATAMPGTALAQSPHAGHGAPAARGEPASTREFRAANAAMHRAMEIRYSGNADRDFVAGMIPHHEGAVEMAKVALEHGKDPEVRALAQKVIAAQEAEIKEMQAWLDKRGAKPAAAADGEVDHEAMGH